MLSKQSITKFKQLWKEHFDEDISDEQAEDEATRLINFVGAVYAVQERLALEGKEPSVEDYQS